MPDGSGYSDILNLMIQTKLTYGSFFSDGTFLYGTTIGGGLNDSGTVFKIMPNEQGMLT